MDATRRLPARSDPAQLLRRLDPGALAAWLLGCGFVLYLALNGGAYDPILRGQAGIAVWWVLVLGIGVAALPLRRPGLAAWVALGLLSALTIWTAIGIGWSESAERSTSELSRIATYLGVFGLALAIRGSQGTRRMVSGLGTAIAIVALVGLLSRLHPSWFPDADQTAEFLTGTRSRLSYPLNFWNGLAALVAIGLPLLLHLATTSRSLLGRGIAAAALPAMALTIFFTLSRGGTAAAVTALVVYLALANDRLPKLATLLNAGLGSAILIAAATQRDALEAGLVNSTASQQGDELTAMALVVCAGVALIQVGIGTAERHADRPKWLTFSRASTAKLLGGLALVGLVIAVIAGAPGKAGDAWDEFKSAEGPGSSSERLESFAGNGRYQYWSAALDQNATEPLTGTGPGTFEYWWSRNGDIGGFVRDTHSLYFETLGELGIVGLALLAGFLAMALGLGATRTLGAARSHRSQLAAATAGCAAFCVAAAFDWIWELAVIPIAMLLLVSVIVTAGDRPPADSRPGFPVRGRLAVAAAAVAAVIAIGIPLASNDAIRESRAAAASNDLDRALESARTAQNVQPYAATPWIQEALLLELQGDLDGAAAAARTATDREATNWRPWVILSRIEAERGRARASVDAYNRARALNPRSPLFAR